MTAALRALSMTVGLVILAFSGYWMVDPASAAGKLAMPLLDGAARSTQLGDLTAFFTATGIMTVLGAWTRQVTWLLASALLLGGTAVFRTLAWAAHGADLAIPAIVLEIVLTLILLATAQNYARNRNTDIAS